MSIGVYPGTFDPFTNGHRDLVERALRSVFNELHICIVSNPNKNTLFTKEERLELTKSSIEGIKKVEVHSFDGLLVDFAANLGATAILRGLRAVSDFEYEFQMASMNRQLNNKLESVFLTPSDQYAFISSSLVKEVAMLGGDISKYVCPEVQESLHKKFT